MELQKLTVNEYCELLSSNSPAPGGGSASALSGAQGASLAAMVCALTLGRKKYADFQEVAQLGCDRMCECRDAFLTLLQTDTDAYNGYRAAAALPKETEAERAARRDAMETATIACILTPLELMKLTVRALELTAILVGRTNPNAVSDLGVAVLNFKAALHGAWLNVKINLPGLTRAELAADFRAQGEALLEKGYTLADDTLRAVEQTLEG